MEVRIAFFDYSDGFSASHSQSILGFAVSGIWHSYLQVFNHWYSFSNFISTDQLPPPSSEFISYGRTARTESEFTSFLAQLAKKIEGRYSLLYLNCHSFTQHCLYFLLGLHLPDNLFNLPRIIRNLPINDYMKSVFLHGIDLEMEGEYELEMSHEQLFGVNLQEIASLVQLSAAQMTDLAVILYWQRDLEFSLQEEICRIAAEYRDRAVYYAVNSEKHPHFGPMLSYTCIEVWSRVRTT